MKAKIAWACGGFLIGAIFVIEVAPSCRPFGGATAAIFSQSLSYLQIATVTTHSPSPSQNLRAQTWTGNMMDSLSESSFFFSDSDSRWMLHKLIHVHQSAVESSCENQCPRQCGGRVWWQFHFEPSFTCPFARRVGPLGFNGKWICNPHRIDELARLNASSHNGCLVYSFRERITSFLFEAAVHSEVSKFCEVHVFSSTPAPISPPENVHYHVHQIGSEPPAIPIQTLVHQFGHDGRSIDIFNIDCHGCEWEQYAGWLHESVFVRQLFIRMSWPHGKRLPFAVPALHKFVTGKGFVVTHKEFDTDMKTCRGSCVDMTFLNLGAEFQTLDNLKPTSPFYELKNLEMPRTSCYQSHRGLGPLVDTVVLQQKLGNADDSADGAGATGAMFQGWDGKGSGSGLSLRESLGYIDEPDADWMRRKLIHKEMSGKQLKAQTSLTNGAFWYYNFDATFNCDFERRLGRFGDGGKWVCDPHRLTQRASKEGCLVYSIGSNGDSSFETSIHDSISSSCEIHTFDMNPWRHYTAQTMPNFINFHVQKIGMEPPAKSIPQIVKDLKHSGRTIDIFKIDCEGCELDTFQSWLDAEVNIRMILVEVHKDRRSQAQIRAFFQYFQSHGYVIYHKEPNTIGCRGMCQEYAFLKLHPDF